MTKMMSLQTSTIRRTSMTSSIPRRNKAFYRGLANGYRSGLEETISEQLKLHKIDVLYETDRINYVVPSRVARYTPDFKLPKVGGIWFLEGKGIWAVADRAKHLLIRDQQPDIDIRFVFSNSRAKLYKGSKTTYADYCIKHGFKWAHKVIPDDWIDECIRASESKGSS